MTAVNICKTSQVNYKNLPTGGYSYTAPGYNSIFDFSQSCDFKMPEKSFVEKLGDAICGLTLITGAVGLVKGLVNTFFPSKKTDGTKSSTDGVKVSTATEKNVLETAMTEADKTGDWQPVNSQVNQSQATYDQNQTAIAACETAIESANQVKATTQGEIDKFKADNTDINTNQIPAAKQERDTAISVSEGKIADYKTQLATAKASGQPTDQLDALIKAEEDNIKKAKETFAQKEAQLNDKIKQNNVKIQTNQDKISLQSGIIKEQTTKKNTLTQSNQTLQQTITEAKTKLELHLGKTS